MFSIIFFATAAHSQTRLVQPCPQPWGSRPRCWGAPLPRAGCPGHHRGWGAPGLDPSTAPLPWASGWASEMKRQRPFFPGAQHASPGSAPPFPGAGRESLPRCRATLPGNTTSLPWGSARPFSGANPPFLLPRSPPIHGHPLEHPHPRP